jgi:HEAT repeat protein
MLFDTREHQAADFGVVARFSPRFVCLALMMFASVILLGMLLYNHEPRYHGLSLTDWENKSLRGTQKEQAEAQEALRAMGKSAVRYLIRVVEKHDSPLKLWILKNFGKRAPILNRWLPLAYDHERHKAAHALGEIGPDASNAIPALLRLKQTNSYDGYFLVATLMKINGEPIGGLIRQLDDPTSAQWQNAAYNLAEFGTNASAAVPALCRGLQTADRVAAAYAIGYIHCQPEIAVPLLMENVKRGGSLPELLNGIGALGQFEGEARSAIPLLRLELSNNDSMIRLSAFGSLYRIFPPDERKSLVPDLLQLINDSDSNLRAVSRYRLKQIDPEAAKAAGVE